MIDKIGAVSKIFAPAFEFINEQKNAIIVKIFRDQIGFIGRATDYILSDKFLVDLKQNMNVIPNKFQKAGSGEPIGLNLSLTRRLKH
jgi:hypothetical protein